MSEREWKIGSVVFGPDRKPVPLLTSQGGKPYNYEFIKGLEARLEQIDAAHRRVMAERDRWQEISHKTMAALCEVDTDIRLDYDGDEVAYAQAVVAQLHEFRTKYHDAMEILARGDNLDKSEAIGRVLEAERTRDSINERLKQAEASWRALDEAWGIRFADLAASAHALRCTCLPEGAGGADPRCVELWGLVGGTGDAEPGPDPLDGFRPDLER